MGTPGTEPPAVVEPVTCPIINTALATAATPLLRLLARLHTTARAPDPTDLRERVEREMRGFERRGRQAGIQTLILRPAQ